MTGQLWQGNKYCENSEGARLSSTYLWTLLLKKPQHENGLGPTVRGLFGKQNEILNNNPLNVTEDIHSQMRPSFKPCCG